MQRQLAELQDQLDFFEKKLNINELLPDYNKQPNALHF
jgi:hypothetical protein